MDKDTFLPSSVLWRKRSPLAHVENINILILHAANDARIPIEQSRIFKEALKEKGGLKEKTLITRSLKKKDTEPRSLKARSEFSKNWKNSSKNT